jgi:hypothetical protein
VNAEIQPDPMTVADQALPIELPVECGQAIFKNTPVRFDRWASINYLVGPNGTGKTTFFNAVMQAARKKWPHGVKVLGTGRLGPLEKSVSRWLGDLATSLFQDDNIESVYSGLFSGQDTAHQAFQLLEKRLDLQIRVLGFLRHVFRKTVQFKSSRKGLQILGAGADGASYQIVDECHGLKELITILTFLYDDAFSVLGIDEPELHLHPQFQRYLLDELRTVAGNPNEKGKKLIFLVTHSPILLELRTLGDLATVIVFSQDAPPQRTQLEKLGAEEILKLKQALPSFHAGQRELIFSGTPILVEGSTDSSVLLNVATKLELPLGAAGIGIAPMGGKYQLLAYRALLRSIAKPNARFILDLDSAITPNVLHCLDADMAVMDYLARAGSGERTLSSLAGDLVGLLRQYARNAFRGGKALVSVNYEPDGSVEEQELAIILQRLVIDLDGAPGSLFDTDAARTISGKLNLIRDAARSANVLILPRGPIETLYATPLEGRNSDFAKQQAFQGELDSIWTSTDKDALRRRYKEVIQFIADAGFLDVPVSEMAREPLGNLIHALQTEIRLGRVKSLEDGRSCPRIVADGYWDISELTELQVANATSFTGTIKMREWLDGDVVKFDHNTRAYELTVRKQETPGAPTRDVHTTVIENRG